MISVGSRDERKGLSLRHGNEGGNMDLKTEIEEGETCFQSNYDDDSTIDPDISLSYIDEKIQNVLGHCRKDFEGGVSAENLGAKFGGYGSFLPTYQRSPVWPHPKTPSKVHTYSAPVSPINGHIEVGHQNPASQSSASQPARNGPASVSTGSVQARKGSSSNGKSKQEVTTSCGDKSTRNGQQSVYNSTNDSDQKSLKVRIKVGSDNLTTRKKAEIYSGLGLDISPSSSLEPSPLDSDEFFHVPQDNPNESPTSILEIMTSFPVSGSLVSPLPYDVLHLTEKEKWEDGSCGPVNKGSQESSVTALHGSDLGKVDQDVLGDLSDIAKEEPKVEELNNKNGGSGGKIWEANNIICDEKNQVFPIKTDSDVSIGSKTFDGGLIKPLKQKDDQKAMKLAPNKMSSSGGKRKSKGLVMENGSQNLDTSKSGLKHESFTSKSKNNAHGSRSEDLKKISRKAVDTYKDFSGELDLKQEDHNEKDIMENESLSKERLMENKSQKPYSPVYASVGSHVATTSNGLVSDAVATTVAPVVNEDWVCCDKCEKWRLLPPGINPSSLPEKWLCSMLDWLPGMNRCSISEEETTKAITSRFPGPSVQGSQPVHPGAPQSGVISHDETHQHFGSQIPNSGLKKKHGSKDLPNEVTQDRPSMSSNSLKKNLHTSYRSRSLNGANKSPVNEVEFQDSGHSRGVIAEKDRRKQKENSFVDEGKNNHHSKINKKRESTQDLPRDYKKVKRDGDYDKRDVAKKRKRSNEVDGKLVKETSETNHRNEKKAKVFNSEDEVIFSRKGKNNEDVKMRSLKVIDSSRQDTIRAATSSSSKVSGSHKTKTNNQEAKGSPVESVSSSPMRILNNIKGVELKKNLNIRPYEEKSKGGRNKSKEGENAKTYGQSKHRHCDDSKVRIDQHSKKALKDVSGKGKSQSLPPRSQNEKERLRKPLVGYQKENNMPLKESKQSKKPQNAPGQTPNRHKGKDQDAPVYIVKELSNQATTNALREATNLKHLADRVKNGGSSLESRALYMEAALKFLHVASVFESCHSETGRYGDMIQSMSIYSSTAKLCKYCADEYERTKEMTTAALAYKCMEVAYMKVIYSSHATASKDVNELQLSLQIGPTGESPSSSASASDLDNLNHPTTIDKVVLPKGVNATQVAGNHVILARHKPNFTRILNFVQDVNSAMEASRLSRIAFAASSSEKDVCLSAIRTALDFNFHDVEEFLHRVRVAMEVINR